MALGISRTGAHKAALQILEEVSRRNVRSNGLTSKLLMGQRNEKRQILAVSAQSGR